MPLDKFGNPRSGNARAAFASAHHTQGPKDMSPAGKAHTAEGGDETPGGEEHMTAHSHQGGPGDMSHLDIKDMVESHGPATKILSEHDHEAGTHHVHSVHGTKHHHSDHESADAAHEHMGHALGGSPDNEEEEETPDEEPESEGGDGGGDGKAPYEA